LLNFFTTANVSFHCLSSSMDFRTSSENLSKAFGLSGSCVSLFYNIIYSLTEIFEKYVLYLFSVVIYNVYFHPLRNFPGPVSWAATRIPWAINIFSGTLYLSQDELHKRYGNIVRIAPDELSFINPQAWKDIYTVRNGKELMHKDGMPPTTKTKVY
jgi:hypothetical protein